MIQLQCASFRALFHNRNKQPQRVFLQYRCSITMINIVKKYMWKKIYELNTLIAYSDDFSHRYRINILQKIACKKSPGGCFHSKLSPAYKASVFAKINPVPPICFHLKCFLWKGLLTVKVRKKIIDQILGYISFCFEICAHLSHLFA